MENKKTSGFFEAAKKPLYFAAWIDLIIFNPIGTSFGFFCMPFVNFGKWGDIYNAAWIAAVLGLILFPLSAHFLNGKRWKYACFAASAALVIGQVFVLILQGETDFWIFDVLPYFYSRLN